jgi:glutamine amidotransferase
MCRLLFIRARTPFAIRDHLETFADISRNSPEFQGHGWGCAWVRDGEWRFHHDIRPVWEDDLDGFGETKLLLAHARSAFRDEGICVENNMPFFDGRYVFIFNGELQGVRIREEGRIGAEKIFNYVKRFENGDMLESASLEDSYLATAFGENPGYFQLHRRQEPGLDLVCSVAYPGECNWQAIENHTVTAL